MPSNWLRYATISPGDPPAAALYMHAWYQLSCITCVGSAALGARARGEAGGGGGARRPLLRVSREDSSGMTGDVGGNGAAAAEVGLRACETGRVAVWTALMSIQTCMGSTKHAWGVSTGVPSVAHVTRSEPWVHHAI